MDWRTLLKIDLGALLRGRGEDEVPDGWRGPRYVLKGGPWYARLSRRDKDLLMITNQLAAFVRANVDLVGGLESLIPSAPRRRLKQLYLALVIDLSTGFPVAGSMRKRSRFFPPYYCDLVQAGEDTGTLAESLAQLAAHLEEKKTTHGTVTGWLTYVLLLLALQSLVVSFVLVKVFPVFDDILAEFSYGRTGGLRFLGNLVDFLDSRWYFIVVDLGLIVAAVYVVHRLFRARGYFDYFVGRVVTGVPGLRVLVFKRDLAHVSLVLEKLLGAGVPIDRAFEDAAALDINPVYRRALRRLARRVAEGKTLHDAMEREDRRLFPATFHGTVSIGESSGLLPDAFGRIGRLYQREVVKVRRVAVRALMPLCLALPAAVVLVITAAGFEFNTILIEIILAEM